MMNALRGARLPERFWMNVQTDGSGCWLWVGRIDRDGYGEYSVNRHWRRAHRVAWQTLVGPIPDGLVIDHLCRVRRCVNPAHLEPVTNSENIRRGMAGAHNLIKTHCPWGHPLEDGNLVTSDARRGGRNCLTCARERSRQQRKLILAAAHSLGLTRNEYVARFGWSAHTAQSIVADTLMGGAA